ncbi:type I-U CRISPR-associated helicase/endonuclease Cas3 [Roseibacillus persicicus]|uniref:type I-G CRISPR-associated helicase/endonuclease Cas3g n=1 Tax=Roseibacillus persicicus TaxID=454148 RepID=UPI00398A5CFB
MSIFPDFPSYYRSLWGYDPFPWQSRLAASLIATGQWPEWVTLPTGTGKTSVLDIAIYHLAYQAAHPEMIRTAPVRIIFAVNRRIVVDEAFEHAKEIGQRLQTCLAEPHSDLYPVAYALCNLANWERALPLETYPLRGATFTDHSWARTPTQPLVISTTLDQLGSRLLFRGYGVSDYARPIHAALLANDALLILDEAHTAKAFSQTLRSIASLRGQASEKLTPPFSAVQLTATPPSDLSTRPLELDDNDYSHPVISSRLRASKPALIMPMVEGATGSSRHRTLSKAILEEVLGWTNSETGPRRILIVVNRVATAEALHPLLNPPDKVDKNGKTKSAKKGHEATVRLLTGRLRPLDRQKLIESLSQTFQLKASTPTPEVPKLILIATQTIEVGADFDFDALITELAPLDSLRQRFGRLNRQGRDILAPAAIVAPEEALEDGKPDPLYGESLPHVWKWLQKLKDEASVVDFGLSALKPYLPTGEQLEDFLAPAPDAPLLLAPHLDLLCQTSPEPHLSPEPSLYIHGPGREFPQISLILRNDLGTTEAVPDLLRVCPPLGTEAATLPLAHARQWLADPNKSGADPSGDAPGTTTKRAKSLPVLTQAFCFRAGETILLKNQNDLRPNDILILSPAEDETLRNLLPLPADGSLDQFEEAHLLARDRFAIRFHRPACDALAKDLADGPRCEFISLTAPLFALDDDDDGRWRLDGALWLETFPKIASLLAENLKGSRKTFWALAAYQGGESSNPRLKEDWRVERFPEGTHRGALLTNRTRVGHTPWPLEPNDLGQEGDQASAEVGFAGHSAGVAARTRLNSTGLSLSLVQTLGEAAELHDLGKLDPRFQALLSGRPIWATVAGEPLAKSGKRSFVESRRLRGESQLPPGFRHELLSALIVSESQWFKDHPEPDLLLHLISSHHGRCRALAPAIADANPEPFHVSVMGESILYEGHSYPLAHLSNGVTLRFWMLTRRFGWWGLPYLETLLRLADQLESAQPSAPETAHK